MTNRLTLFCTTGDTNKILALAHRDYAFASFLIKIGCSSKFTGETIMRTAHVLNMAQQPTKTWGSVFQAINSEN